MTVDDDYEEPLLTVVEVRGDQLPPVALPTTFCFLCMMSH